MKPFSEYLQENRLYDATTKDEFLKDDTRVVNAFLINFVGFVAAYHAAKKKEKILAYLKSDLKLRVDNITDDNHDMSLIIKIMNDKKMFKQSNTVNQITRFLAKLKTGTVKDIDANIVKDWIEGVKPAELKKANKLLRAVKDEFMQTGNLGDYAIMVRHYRHKFKGEIGDFGAVLRGVTFNVETRKDNRDIFTPVDGAPATTPTPDTPAPSTDPVDIADPAPEKPAAQAKVDRRDISALGTLEQAQKVNEIIPRILKDGYTYQDFTVEYKAKADFTKAIVDRLISNTMTLAGDQTIEKYQTIATWLEDGVPMGWKNANFKKSRVLTRWYEQGGVNNNLERLRLTFESGLAKTFPTVFSTELKRMVPRIAYTKFAINDDISLMEAQLRIGHENINALEWLNANGYFEFNMHSAFALQNVLLSYILNKTDREKMMAVLTDPSIGVIKSGDGYTITQFAKGVKKQYQYVKDVFKIFGIEEANSKDKLRTVVADALASANGFETDRAFNKVVADNDDITGMDLANEVAAQLNSLNDDQSIEDAISALDRDRTLMTVDAVKDAVNNLHKRFSSNYIQIFATMAVDNYFYQSKSIKEIVMINAAAEYFAVSDNFISWFNKVITSATFNRSTHINRMGNLINSMSPAQQAGIKGALPTAARNILDRAISNVKAEIPKFYDRSYSDGVMGDALWTIGTILGKSFKVFANNIDDSFREGYQLALLDILVNNLPKSLVENVGGYKDTFRWMITIITDEGTNGIDYDSMSAKQQSTFFAWIYDQDVSKGFKDFELLLSPAIVKKLSAKQITQLHSPSAVSLARSLNDKAAAKDVIEKWLTGDYKMEIALEPETLGMLETTLQLAEFTDKLDDGLANAIANGISKTEVREFAWDFGGFKKFIMNPEGSIQKNPKNLGVATEASLKYLDTKFSKQKKEYQENMIHGCEIWYSLVENDRAKAQEIYQNSSPAMMRRLASHYLSQQGFSTRIEQALHGKDVPIQPYEKLDANRIKQILKYNNVDSSETKLGMKVIKTLDTMDAHVEQEGKNMIIEDLRVTTVEKTPQELEKMTADFHRTKRNGKHGRIGMKILREFNVAIPMQVDAQEQWIAKMPEQEIINPMYHGTGGTAASMILRYGFRVVSSGDASVVGRMLGDGVYGAIHIDKSQQYVGDAGFGRSVGTKGYLFAMNAALGEKGKDYQVAGLGGDSIRSPEWCVFTPNSQFKIEKAYEVELTDEYEMDKILSKYPQLKEGKMMKFGEYITEESKPVAQNYTTFTFVNGRIPMGSTFDDLVEFEDFVAPNDRVSMEPSAYGPTIVVRDTAESEDFMFASFSELKDENPEVFEKFLSYMKK